MLGHEDVDLFTFLPAPRVEGLQVLNRANMKWIRLEAPPGTHHPEHRRLHAADQQRHPALHHASRQPAPRRRLRAAAGPRLAAHGRLRVGGRGARGAARARRRRSTSPSRPWSSTPGSRASTTATTTPSTSSRDLSARRRGSRTQVAPSTPRATAVDSRLLHGRAQEEGHVGQEKGQGQGRVERHAEGGSPPARRSRNRTRTMKPSITRMRAMASESSFSKVPVAARAEATTPTRIMAVQGVPPALTRASTLGARPSRARPKIDARGDEDVAVQGSEHHEQRQRGHQRSGAGAEDLRRHVARDEGGRGDALHGQHLQEGGVQQQVERGDSEDAEQEDARQSAIGIVDLLGDLGRVGIAVVGPDHGLEGQGERAPDGEARGRVGQGGPPSGSAAREARDHHHGREGRHLGRGGEVLRPAAGRDTRPGSGPSTGAIRTTPRTDAPLGGQSRRRDRYSPLTTPDGGDGGAVDEPFDPAHDEGGAPAVGLACVHVLAAGLGMPGRELGEHERAEQADDAPEHPGHEGEAGAARAARPRGPGFGRCRSRRRCPRPWPARRWFRRCA